ncbi:hypothetical protein JCM17380_07790 [Desulfosporosinus burensis]
MVTKCNQIPLVSLCDNHRETKGTDTMILELPKTRSMRLALSGALLYINLTGTGIRFRIYLLGKNLWIRFLRSRG